MPHDAALVDGDGCHSGANIDKGDTGRHFGRAQDRARNHIRKEVLLGHGYPKLVEDLVQGNRCAPFADEHLEIALQGA